MPPKPLDRHLVRNTGNIGNCQFLFRKRNRAASKGAGQEQGGAWRGIERAPREQRSTKGGARVEHNKNFKGAAGGSQNWLFGTRLYSGSVVTTVMA